MAQTLNPRANVFCPTFPEERLDFEYLLPNSLLVSPKGRGRSSFRSFEPVPFCRSPRGYHDFRGFSDLPQQGKKEPYYENLWDLESTHGSVWDDFSPSVLQQEFLKMERERDIAYGRIMPQHAQQQTAPRHPLPDNNEYSKNHNNYRQQSTRSSPQQRPMAPQRLPYQEVQKPQHTAKHASVVQRQTTPPKQHVPESRKNAGGQNLPAYDMECLLHLVRSQLEFYFSDQNLFEEMHSNLQYYMKLDSKLWVPVHVLLDLPSIKKLTSETEVVLKALRSSTLLELNDDETKCRRPNYVPPSDYKVRKNLRRSVLVYGLPEQMTDESLRRLLDMHGNILCVAFAGMEEGPDADIGNVIMTKKFNDINPDSLKTAFVVFESQSQANKCVKARSRHSIDGVRTMHKYDYNKVVKRLGKGVSPLFTPVPAPTNNMPLNQLQQQGNQRGMMKNNNNYALGNKNNNNNFKLNSQQQQAPIFMKRNNQQQINNHLNNSNLNNQGFRKPQQNSHQQKWRSPAMKGSGSLNWRANNSPMRQRSNSTQNRSVSNSNNGEFSKVRFSKENLSAYPVLNTRSHI